MRAAVVYGENDMRIAEVPNPEAGPGEVLVKVRASGVCATDVKILGGAGLPKDLPTILGHEVAGTIEAIGPDVSGLETGQRVAVYPIAVCGECFYCARGRHSLCSEQYGLAHGADGGFAEYVLVPSRIVRLNGVLDIGDMPFDLAATVEPVSCCLAAAEHCGTKANDTVVVIGCGFLGLLHIVVSKSIGARVIALEQNEDRLAMAKAVGAEVTINTRTTDVPDAVRSYTRVGADVVIAAVGLSKVVEQYLPLVRNGGVFNIFGGTPRGESITVDPRWIHYGEVVLTGTFGASLHHFQKALEFVGEHSRILSDLISVRCRLDGIFEAVESVKNCKAFKTVIVFDQD